MAHPLQSDEENDFKEVNTTNFQRIHDKITKVGYVDGVSDGREASFQDSFDQGYSDGLKTGFELEKIRAFYETLSTHGIMSEQLLNERTLYQQMQLPETKSRNHFKYLENLNEPLAKITSRQEAYVEQLMNMCASTMPTTTSLLTYN